MPRSSNIGVGAFWGPFQLLGLFAALLPGALHWRMLVTVGLALALCAEIFYLYGRVVVALCLFMQRVESSYRMSKGMKLDTAIQTSTK